MIEEQIKQAADEYCIGIMREQHSSPRSTFNIQYSDDVEKHFIAGANFGRELEMKDGWIDVNDHLPDELETVWITNGKGWTTLGCWSYFDENEWCWAETNGTIYQDGDEIVAECEAGDLDVKYWHRLPKPIKV